jgi:hypothetical protein
VRAFSDVAAREFAGEAKPKTNQLRETHPRYVYFGGDWIVKDAVISPWQAELAEGESHEKA